MASLFPLQRGLMSGKNFPKIKFMNDLTQSRWLPVVLLAENPTPSSPRAFSISARSPWAT